VALSAFNLRLQLEGGEHATVESAFQASKKFAQAGPFPELLEASSRDAKRDSRLRDSGPLVGFELQGERWPLTPRTAFYDWLYLKALEQHQDLAAQLLQHDLFTDIEFNPERSLNCQARSCALYVSLHQAGLLEDALSDRVRYLDILLHTTP
jgi:type I restriction enzyme M protein